MRSLLLLIALAGCAATGGEPGGREADAFARELAGRTAGEPESCVAAIQNQPLRIVDRRTIAYERGDTIWVNRLERDCPGLRPLNTLIVEVHGSQYCRGDRVRGLETGATIPGPICILRDFVPYRQGGTR
ncbi:MAG: hypothetical protein M3Q08_12005 [Pseudomonadota bacterium]|nr:hypothetical protein [Pseudomonadota bacterium]